MTGIPNTHHHSVDRNKKKEDEFRVYILEDDDWYRDLLSYIVSLNPDYEITKFSRGMDLIRGLRRKPHVVTLDYKLPDMSGEDVFRQIKDVDPDIEVVVVSDQEKIETALSLLKMGAYDYIVKSADVKEKLLNVLQRIRSNTKLKSRITELEQEVRQRYHFENFMIGQSEPMQQVFRLMQKATETNITVCITGETGTGKEVVAKAIHYNSKRKEGPFVAVNVAAIPADLAESELFGHEKGSFTGAILTRIGKFEEANGGTLLLDEIGEMEPALQAKLLRVLQEKEVCRIGSNKNIPIDCRIIVSTNKDLPEQVKAGKFREDLYYRVIGLQIHLTPLRERGNDVLLLAKHFVEGFCKENDMDLKTISPEAQDRLLQYPFPGNVREVKSVMELASAMSNGQNITAADIVFPRSNNLLSELLKEESTLEEYENKIIMHFLKKYDDNVLKVAKKLGIGKTTIYKMLKERSEPDQAPAAAEKA